MTPLPRAAPGSVVSLDGDLYNFIADQLQRLDKWTVQPPLNLQQTPAGNLLSMAPSSSELVLVAILGTETGGGYYHGSILYGSSNGGTGGTNTNSPATYNFQLEYTTGQTQTDGPVWQTASGGGAVNNALIVNLPEQFVASHKLYYSGQGLFTYAVGRVMGKTSESTPRTIVYIDEWPIRPVICKITSAYSQTIGGTYEGEIVAGPFASSSNTFNFPLQDIAPNGIIGTSDCWITNVWEQANVVNSAANQIANGTFVPGLLCGWPLGTGTGSGVWYQVYTWYPIQAATPGASLATQLTTGMAAGTAYTPNEQLMLNRLVSDMTNVHTFIASFYANMKHAGYTL
ncbi:MAG: hypothetical protein ABSG31_15915 [Tepidisphaeraceae bacterium]|jgi:hypothetical protein